MDSKKADINTLFNILIDSCVKLPQGFYPSVDGLTKALYQLDAVLGKRKFDETSRFVCNVLDSARFRCLNNGYNVAVSTGNAYMAQLCSSQLSEFKKQSNASVIDVNCRTSETCINRSAMKVKSFPYAESLLNDKDCNPVKNNFVFNDRSVVSNNLTEGKLWPFATKLLDGLNDKSTVRSNDARIPSKYLDNVNSTGTNVKRNNFSSDCNNQSTSKTKCVLPVVTMHSVRGVSSTNVTGIIDKLSHSRGVSNENMAKSRNDVSALQKKLDGGRTKVACTSLINTFLKSMKTDSISANSVKKAVKSDKESLLINCAAKTDKPMCSVKNTSQGGKKYISAPTRSSERLSKLTSSKEKMNLDNKRNEVFDNSQRKGNRTNKSQQKIKGTPRILKQNSEKGRRETRQKNVSFNDVLTPVRRYSKLTNSMTRCKRKHDSSSSVLNSTLRPKVKRFQTVALINQCDEDCPVKSKISNAQDCKGTVDSRSSCANTLDYTAATTESSALVETPRSTLSNRRGKVRIFYRRNLFSTPRERGRKKWIK